MTLGVFSLYSVRRQEHKANGIMAGLRQFDIELGTFFDQKGVRQLKKDTRAVAGIHIGALTAAVVHIAQHHKSLPQDLVGFTAFDVGDDTQTAGVVLEPGIIKPLLGR